VTTTRSRQAGNGHGIILLLSAVMPIMAVTSLIPVLPQLMCEFADVPGASALVPIALTIPALCVALFSPLAGWLSDKLGRKRLLVTALTTYALFGFLPWFLEDLGSIIVSRVLLGIVEAIIMTVATALIGDYYEGERRERWIAIQVAVSSVAATVLLAVGGLLGEAFGSRGPFLLYLSSLGVAVAAAFILHEPARQARTEQVVAGQRGALMTVLPLALITLGVGFAFYTIFVQIGPFLELTGRVTPTMVGLAGAIVNLGVVAGSVAFKRMSGKGGPRLLAIGLTITAAGYAGVALSTSFVGITAFATLACLGSGITLPNMLTWTMRSLPPAVRGRGLGIWTGSFFLGQFVAPLLVGALALQMGGFSIVLGLLAAIIALSALVTALTFRRSSGRRVDTFGGN
jgi:Arabinose efflux permease